MNLINFCYLWTLLFTIGNLAGIVKLSWFIVLAPTMIWLILAAVIIVLSLIAIINSNK